MNLFQELSQASEYDGVADLARIANRTLARNVECFVAQYFVQNPDAKVADLALVYTPSFNELGGYRFHIVAKVA